ncbi:hypothetical protein [Falsiroseomonas sp. HW251]|uniref:hypothetical protein n=1 Tax=Falsiroseomonas sp. HW251 TaxID=3390998 RepID=UPI003D31A835
MIAALAHFALGYLAVLAAPGPNMVAIGVLAALRGSRAVLPFVAGIAVGAGSLALGLMLLFGALDIDDEAMRAARAIGGVLLLLVALRVLRSPAPVARSAPPGEESVGGALLGFGAGFCTAATNPITAAYFVAQFLGPLAETGAAPLAVPLVALQALGFGVFVAHVFGQAGARRFALAWHRPICVVAGGALAMLAMAMLLPAVRA